MTTKPYPPLSTPLTARFLAYRLVLPILAWGLFLALSIPVPAQETDKAASEPAAGNSQQTLGTGKTFPPILVEETPGKNWDEKIRNSINKAIQGGGTTIILPAQTIPISETIKWWRQLRTDTVDTLCEGVEMREISQVWAAIKGGKPEFIPRGLTFQGTPGVTTLLWTGGPNQVMLDMPAPWNTTVRGIVFDGGNAEGLIGLRYRAAWEFGLNGGKLNHFEDLAFFRMDVCVDIGGIFNPDLVASSFERCQVNAARIGFRLTGGNVAEMSFRNGLSNHLEDATFKLKGHRARTIRSLAEKDESPGDDVLRDIDGKEIFLEQIPDGALTWKTKRSVPVRKARKSASDGKVRPWVGGGGPSQFISQWCGLNRCANAWFIDSNGPSVRIEHLRMEGAAGFYRNTGELPSRRFTDQFIDVNLTTPGNTTGYVVRYEKQGPILFIGGTFEGLIGLGEKAICQVIGTRFDHTQRIMPGTLREGEKPAGDFYEVTGKIDTLPHRRLPGLAMTSKTHERIGFVHLPGTSGARLLDAFGEHSLLEAPEKPKAAQE